MVVPSWSNTIAGMRALEAVLQERLAQDAKWGEQSHEPEIWLAILTEEVGELAQAILERRFGGPAGAHLLVEAVQVAAVGLAIVECCERNGWMHPCDEGGE